ncbi:anthranilate synthase component I [Polymorphobacter fuscus]|uniref:Anthranilate synthase component 1 n=1 Tax=Sandarakinorhabdus fusca TaxID=1439888 RepID=A0A7C9KW31_9SPHN|nr:anthranilate synthase component I [Polymorphobacter fuscus]KAB7648770.1 anthranilate synthase component I [Polymorphobacter fuscus]MQT16342.1 anthranilate synthase component I [Polymorphobacter fuscus]NJC07370.1 anthranilate synthase component 1 [Polymorphobacter fuscus]
MADFGSIAPSPADFAAALGRGAAQLVWTRIVADTETPVSAMLKLGAAQSGSFLLESVEGGQVRGRYSLLGLDPDLVWRATGDSSAINRDWRRDRDAFVAVPGGALAALRALVAEARAEVPPELPPALACLVGYIGYEAVRLVEPSVPANAPSPLALPDMVFVRPTLILVFDRLKDELFLVAPVFAADDADLAYAEAVERIETAQARLAGTPAAALKRPATLPDGTPTPRLTPAAYAAMVARAKEYILAGDVFQVVLAQRFSVDFPLPPFDLYRALRRINPSPFLYFLDLPDFALVGSSPEILVRVRDGDVTIRPIAGTRPRGRDAVEDAENRASLLADAKEQAEHLMLLDLGRHDTGRVSLPGTVTVTDRAGVEFYSHVMHIVSNVRGRLDPRNDAVDALLAGFPAGTVSGAPKVRAMQVIAELEPEARGAYAGGVGYFSPDGSMDSCIVLRTAVVKDGVMHVQAGAGIVADSVAEYEQRECEAKAGALMAAAREALRAAAAPGFGQ